MIQSSGSPSSRFGRLFAFVPVAAVSGCSLLLDFDELQTETGKVSGGAAGASGAGGNGGSPSQSKGGGAGKGATCPTACEDTDQDPCTVSRCVVEAGTAECRTQAIEGLVFERELPEIAAEDHHQLALVAGPDAFYLSAFSTVNGVATADIYRMGVAADAPATRAVSLGGVLGARDPVSLAALAVDDDAGLRIHAYIGLRELIGTRARPFRISFDENFLASPPEAVGPGYYLNSQPPIVHRPAALNLGGTVWGAWINEDGSVGLDSPTVTRTIRLGALGTPATSVALLGSAGGRPAVLYTGPTGRVFLQSENGLPTAVTECEAEPGLFLSSATAPTTYDGLWLSTWTKAGMGYLTSESAALFCSAEGVCWADMTCASDEIRNGRKNVAVATANPPGDGAGVIYYLFVVPALKQANDLSVTAEISASLVRSDYGTSPTLDNVGPTEIVGLPVLLAEKQKSPSPAYPGPDLAAAAIVANQAAIAWTEPNQAGDGEVIRLRRYALCFPE